MTNDDRSQKMLDMIIAEQANPEAWWWLSFCDSNLPKGEQFLGACIVRARGFISAIREAHKQGCNPGGEVEGLETRSDFRPLDGWTNRLLSRNECEEFDRLHNRRN